MSTDSKIFCLHKTGAKLWYPKRKRPVQHLPKNTPKVHVYYCVTWHGPTQPIFVTCGGSQQSPINDAPTGQPMKGVGAKDYVQNVLYPLLDAGKRLFKGDRLYSSSWIYQQDGAPAHISKETKDILNVVTEDRWITDWPANSPDVSWIENTWAWAEGKLHRKRASPRTAHDSKTAVAEILQSLPIDICCNYVSSMGRRIEKVIKCNGGTI